MAIQFSRGFRNVTINCLTDLSKSEQTPSKVIALSEDGNFDVAERIYNDAVDPSELIREKRNGNILLRGDIEDLAYPLFAAGSQSSPAFFELDEHFLIEFLALDVKNGNSEMIYGRWVGLMEQQNAVSKEAGQIGDGVEISLRISQFLGGASVGFAENVPYDATGASDATPTGDYDPLFVCRVSDATKTIAAARTEAGVTQP